jgi:nitroimidazol reductase NimA-like FMN-containing flavoprotein (pyridoxamine 5'-phosphate oxidase superfamily)
MVGMEHDEIIALLHSAKIGRLAMADGQGQPYVIPLPFCWLNGAIYVRLPLSGRKGRILAKNDQVCFEVDAVEGNFAHYASVLVEGRLVRVADMTEAVRAKHTMNVKYTDPGVPTRAGSGRAPIPEEGAGDAIRKLVVDQMSGVHKPGAGVKNEAVAAGKT